MDGISLDGYRTHHQSHSIRLIEISSLPFNRVHQYQPGKASSCLHFILLGWLAPERANRQAAAMAPRMELVVRVWLRDVCGCFFGVFFFLFAYDAAIFTDRSSEAHPANHALPPVDDERLTTSPPPIRGQTPHPNPITPSPRQTKTDEAPAPPEPCAARPLGLPGGVHAATEGVSGRGQGR